MDESSFTTHDALSGDEAYILVRREDEHVRLAVSLMSDGDYELFLDKAAVRQLAEALTRAAE